MKIIILPETAEESRIKTPVEHTNVKEFFIFGNKIDEDDEAVDFHDWKGSYRYLISNLGWFQSEVSEEKKSKQPIRIENPQLIDQLKSKQSHGVENSQLVNQDVMTKEAHGMPPFINLNELSVLEATPTTNVVDYTSVGPGNAEIDVESHKLVLHAEDDIDDADISVDVVKE